MAHFATLFSSSSGNCTYIGTYGGGILIDVGVSASRTQTALAQLGLSPPDIGAIFITHEHSDHICGLKTFAGRHHIDVWASAGTLAQLDRMEMLTQNFCARELPQYGAVEAEGMLVRPFSTPHDSAQSVGYTVMLPDGRRVAVATDLGTVTRQVMNAIYGCDLVMLESNHDVGMLKSGPYPHFLKQRILSDRGHLSNDSCSNTAVELLEGGTTRFVLGHLSRHNNFPELAFETTNSALSMHGAVRGSDYLLEVACDNGRMIKF